SISTAPGSLNSGIFAAGSVVQIGTHLADSAVLSGGYYETGTITFKLYAPNGNVVYTDVVTVNRNGTYYTDNNGTGSEEATVGGTYQWVASYGGDGNNKPIAGNKGDEPEVVLSTERGLTRGFYANSNGQALLTGSATGTTVNAAIISFLQGTGNDSAGH